MHRLLAACAYSSFTCTCAYCVADFFSEPYLLRKQHLLLYKVCWIFHHAHHTLYDVNRTNQSRIREIVKNLGVCVPNSWLHCLWISTTFSNLKCCFKIILPCSNYDFMSTMLLTTLIDATVFTVTPSVEKISYYSKQYYRDLIKHRKSYLYL